MEVLIVVGAVGALGIAAGLASLAWPLYVNPMMRRRYERNHHRAKATARHSEPTANK